MVDLKNKDIMYRSLAIASCKLIGSKKNVFIESLSDESRVGVTQALKSMPQKVLTLASCVSYEQLMEILGDLNIDKQLNKGLSGDFEIPNYLDLSKFSGTITCATKKLVGELVSDIRQEKGLLNE